MSIAISDIEVSGIQRLASGKVREIFAAGDALLLVATDRISAYDSIMPNPIPDKGRVLTQVSEYWFRRLRTTAVNHLITTDDRYVLPFLLECGAEVTRELAEQLHGRCTLCVRAEPLPVECVVRGYISGSLWAEYCQAGGPAHGVEVHGVVLPAGLRESDVLPQPVFTPATKAASGHDENISMAQAETILGRDLAREIAGTSIALYREAARHASSVGLILADTKFEFGMYKGVLTLIDEALTPDSSRYWDAAVYAPGGAQASFDKQFVRDWLTSSGWNREPPAPALPVDVVEKTAAKYREAYQRITGCTLS